VAAHPRCSAKVSRESVEAWGMRRCMERRLLFGNEALMREKLATGGTAALVQIFARTVKGMPKWVVVLWAM